ncbi:MAG: 50S ribosomal protein L13 [Candidatus Aenigmatarchaeota archaeon]
MLQKTIKEEQQVEEIEIDANNKSLGRLSTLIAYYLQGKHKPNYAPYIDFPVYVKIKNWKNIKFTGNKFEKKLIYKHTGYIGHLRKYTLKELWQRNPLKIIQKAVAGMLPKNKLRKNRLKRIILVE